jgi:integration host factor subunit beta
LVRSEIIKRLIIKNPNLKKLVLESILDLIFNSISNSLINNKSVELRNFGRFSLKTTKAKKKARNPRTNEIIYVPEKKKVFFKMAKQLKEVINKDTLQ